MHTHKDSGWKGENGSQSRRQHGVIWEPIKKGWCYLFPHLMKSRTSSPPGLSGWSFLCWAIVCFSLSSNKKQERKKNTDKPSGNAVVCFFNFQITQKKPSGNAVVFFSFQITKKNPSGNAIVCFSLFPDHQKKTPSQGCECVWISVILAYMWKMNVHASIQHTWHPVSWLENRYFIPLTEKGQVKSQITSYWNSIESNFL